MNSYTETQSTFVPISLCCDCSLLFILSLSDFSPDEAKAKSRELLHSLAIVELYSYYVCIPFSL